jgi:hypothetical protein
MKRVFQAWQAKESRPTVTPKAIGPRALRGRFSRLTRLSLVELHPCRAPLRFTWQGNIVPPRAGHSKSTQAPTGSAIQNRHKRLPGRPSKIDTSAYRLKPLKIDTPAPTGSTSNSQRELHSTNSKHRYNRDSHRSPTTDSPSILKRRASVDFQALRDTMRSMKFLGIHLLTALLCVSTVLTTTTIRK